MRKSELEAKPTRQSILDKLKIHSEVLDLRVKGESYVSIGEQLGLSPGEVYRIVADEINRLRSECAETAEMARSIERKRLDKMQLRLDSQIDVGNLRAIEVALKVGEARRKMDGLDAPTETVSRITSAHLVVSASLPATAEEAREVLRGLIGDGI